MIPATIRPPHARLLEAFLTRRSPATRDAYERDLRIFSGWLGAPVEVACSWLVQAGRLEGSARVLEFVRDQSKTHAPATVARRLASLRSLVQLGRLLGVCDWELEVPPPRVMELKDSRGPGRERVQALIEAAGRQRNPLIAARDVAILRLLYDLGLRRGEVCSLGIEDLRLESRDLWVKGKGMEERIRFTLPQGTAASLQAWVNWRGADPGPLFHRLDNAGAFLHVHVPLTGRAVLEIVTALGQQLGFTARPHGLRHSAITDALEAGFDVRTVQQFSRHADLNTLVIYDDRRKDFAGQVAASLAGGKR